MKSLKLSLMLVGFCLLNYFIDIWVHSFHILYSMYTALIVFCSPAFIVRCTIFDVASSHSCDWMLDLPLTIVFWALIIKLIRIIYEKNRKSKTH